MLREMPVETGAHWRVVDPKVKLLNPPKKGNIDKWFKSDSDNK